MKHHTFRLAGGVAGKGFPLEFPQPVVLAPYQSTASNVCREEVDAFESAGQSKTIQAHFCCVDGNVGALAPHEQTGPQYEWDSLPVWVSNENLKDILQTVFSTPLKCSGEISLIDPVTARQLDLRLHQAMAHSPPPSLSRLIKYHDQFPSLQSVSSYYTLIQLAIRHTTYTAAFRLFNSMEARKLKSNVDLKLLFVRLLVRTGRSPRAWNYIRQEMPVLQNGDILRLVVELLGHRRDEDFGMVNRNGLLFPSRKASSRRGPRYRTEGIVQSHRDNRPLVLSVISSMLPSGARPSHHFVFMVVRYLLQISQVKIAQTVTLDWLSNIPNPLTAIRRRHCLSLLHLHLGCTTYGLRSHFDCRRFIASFLKEQRFDLRPTSSTLFLLLRSLTRARGKVTFHAIQLATAMRRKWGSTVIDTRVRRRIVSIALHEGRPKAAQKWLAKDMGFDASRRRFMLQRVVVGEPIVNLSNTGHQALLRKLTASTHEDGRLWRFTKRRLWRRLMRKKYFTVHNQSVNSGSS